MAGHREVGRYRKGPNGEMGNVLGENRGIAFGVGVPIGGVISISICVYARRCVIV